MEIPVLDLERVFHIGSMKKANVGANSGAGSLEGGCMSVSVCPHAWREIAKLGGNGLHDLQRRGGVFVDVVAVMGDAELKASVLDWAAAEGLVTTERRWEAWSFDEETEEWRFFLASSEAEALEELGLEGISEARGAGPDGGSAVVQVEVPIGTDALRKLTGMACRGDEDATDAAVMAWSMVQAPGLLGIEVDGVWWRENYDPGSLSAPRGGIFPDRVPMWTHWKMDWNDVDDDEEISVMPEPRLMATNSGPAPR